MLNDRSTFTYMGRSRPNALTRDMNKSGDYGATTCVTCITNAIKCHLTPSQSIAFGNLLNIDSATKWTFSNVCKRLFSIEHLFKKKWKRKNLIKCRYNDNLPSGRTSDSRTIYINHLSCVTGFHARFEPQHGTTSSRRFLVFCPVDDYQNQSKLIVRFIIFVFSTTQNPQKCHIRITLCIQSNNVQ